MQKSDGAPSPATASAAPTAPLRDLGGNKRDDRIALAIGVFFFALLLAAALWLSSTVFEEKLEDLTITSRDAAETLAHATADDIAKAVGYGIPLERLRGTETYLAGIVDPGTLVSMIAVLGPDERLLFRAPAGSGPVPGSAVRAPIVVDGAVVGSILAEPSPRIVDGARERLYAAAVASALVIASFVAVVLRLAGLERTNLPQARIGASASAVGHGVFADFTPAPRGPIRRIGQRAAHRMAPLRRQYRQLMQLTDEVRALDTSGVMTERIAAAVAPLERYHFDRPLHSRVQPSVRLRWPLFALACLLAARPLVASFAADRIGSDPLAGVAVASSLAAFAIGGIAGLFLARLRLLRGTKLARFLGMVVAGLALGATAFIRDAMPFVLAEFVTGLFGMLALASAFMAEGSAPRAPWRTGLVLIAATAIGLPLGALLAEAEGRRLAFATVGALAVISGFVAIGGPASRPRTSLPRIGLPLAAMASVTATVAVMVSFIEVDLSVARMRENYAGLALASALVGAAAFLPVTLLPRRIAILAPLGALLAALALTASLAGLPVYAAAILIGLAFGTTFAGVGAKGVSAGSVCCFLLGILLAAVAEATTALLVLPQGVVACAVTLIVALVGLGAHLKGAR